MVDHDGDFRVICRICLAFCDHNTVSLLDEKSTSKLSCYGQSVLVFAEVSISPQDGLPEQMCYNCLFLLKQAIKFKFTCEQSHRQLTKRAFSGDSNSNRVEHSLYHESLVGSSENFDTNQTIKPVTVFTTSKEEPNSVYVNDNLNDDLFICDAASNSGDASEDNFGEHDSFKKKNKGILKKNKTVDYDDLLRKMELVIEAQEMKRQGVNLNLTTALEERISVQTVKYLKKTGQKKLIFHNYVPKQVNAEKVRNKIVPDNRKVTKNRDVHPKDEPEQHSDDNLFDAMEKNIDITEAAKDKESVANHIDDNMNDDVASNWDSPVNSDDDVSDDNFSDDDSFNSKKESVSKKNKTVDYDDLLEKMEMVIHAQELKRMGIDVNQITQIEDRKSNENSDQKRYMSKQVKAEKRRSKKNLRHREVSEPLKQPKDEPQKSSEDSLLDAIELLVSTKEANMDIPPQIPTSRTRQRTWRASKQRRNNSEVTGDRTASENMSMAQRYRQKLALRRQKDWILAKEVAKSKNTPKQCKQCNKMLANASSLKAHMQRHETHKYICEHCGHSTTTYSELQAHLVARHGAGKVKKCPLCDFKAFRNYDMNEHARTHTGERPFSCEKCGITFTRQSVWRRHRRYHQEKRFQCPLCPRRFHFREHMSAHSNNVHARQYVFACSRCDGTYAKAGTVRRHLLEKHGVPREEQGKITRIKKGEPGAWVL